MPFDTPILENYLIKDVGLEVFNPATSERLATVKDFSVEEAEEIIKRANLALAKWSNLTAKERGAILKLWNDLILEYQETLAEIITLESGKPLAESKGEVAYGASFVEWFAEEGKRVYGDVIPTYAKGKRPIVIKQPVGVTAAITPWNFPLAMITRKVAPALAAGCPMIVKPAEATPLTALAIEFLAHKAGIPEAVFRVITTTHPSEIGKVFCNSSIVRKLSFTGSTAVGKILLVQCAQTVKRVSMELGGNAPFIVFDDANLDAAIDGAIASKYRNAGQTCVCANRFLVQEGIHDTFVERLKERVSKFKVGNGLDKGVEIGPLINESGLEKIARLVQRAKSSGATSELGGNCHSAGNAFFEPTVLTRVTPEMDIAKIEIFGPVAPIIKFSSEDEAISIANDTPYGLAAYFFTENAGRVWRVMEALEYGMVGVNDGMFSTEVAPFGGVKESGIGREGSRHGIDEYLELKYALMGGLNA